MNLGAKSEHSAAMQGLAHNTASGKCGGGKKGGCEGGWHGGGGGNGGGGNGGGGGGGSIGGGFGGGGGLGGPNGLGDGMKGFGSFGGGGGLSGLGGRDGKGGSEITYSMQQPVCTCTYWNTESIPVRVLHTYMLHRDVRLRFYLMGACNAKCWH